MRERLRILMVSPTPLRVDMGGGRVQLELAEELRRLGHVVETFDVRDAFPHGTPRSRVSPMPFAARAREFVRRNGARFDVIDALQAALPFDKEALSFDGLLVVRSTGLYAFYEAFLHYQVERWPHLVPGTRLGQLLRRRSDAAIFQDGRRSLLTADLAVLLTQDEVDWVSAEFGPSDRWVVVPNGLTDPHGEALTRARDSAADRLAQREVSFIGSWDLRKGAADWPELVRLIRGRVPDARFLFLGTGNRAVAVEGDGVRVVPAFQPDELPVLLSGSAAGLLPTYAEGWGLGLLEQLAAGIPTVAYDVSGPRAMLGDVSEELLVPRGDARAAAARVAQVLELAPAAHEELAQQCIETARRFRWSDIARTTANLYAERLSQVRK